MKRFYSGLCVVALMGSLGGCAGTGAGVASRADLAQTIAVPASLTREDIAAPPFHLASWRRISAPGQPVNVYIEGDGLAWLGRSSPSGNPTPTDPLALRLAAADRSPNVVYLARPCQYTELGAPGNACPRAYWMGERFAPEVVDSYGAALDALAARYGLITGFHLIGYSGGANIAALLASRRGDILSLRTVAGNLDNDYFTELHRVSPMPRSLNAAGRAYTLAGLPQLHFIGGRDEQVPGSVFESYRAKAGPSACIRARVLPAASHSEGWAEAWPGLLAEPVACIQTR